MATAKEAAKDFIRFFYSDKNLVTYARATKSQLPLSFGDGTFELDTAALGWTRFNEDFLAYRENRIASVRGPAYYSKLYTTGAADMYATNLFVRTFASHGDKTTGQAMWNTIADQIRSKYPNWITDAAIEA